MPRRARADGAPGELARAPARALAEGTRTQWAVTVGLVPFTLVLFGQVSLVSPLANAVAIPVVTLAVAPLAVAGIAWPGDACFVAAHALLAPLMRMMEALASLPAAAWAQHTPIAWTLPAAARRRRVDARAARRSGARARRAVAPAAVRRAAAAAARGRRARHRARRRAGARGRRAHPSPRAGVRHRSALARQRRCGRPHRRAVPAPRGCRACRPAGRQPPGPRPRGRRGVAGASGSGRAHRLVVARRSSAVRRGSRRAVAAMRGRAALGVRRRALRGAASGAGGTTRTPRAKTNDLSCVVPSTRGGARVLLAGDIEARSEIAAGARRPRCARGARARRAASRQPHLVDARVRRRGRPRDRDLHARLPQPFRASAARHGRALRAAARRRCGPTSTAPSRSTSAGRGRWRRARARRVRALLAHGPQTSAARLDP